MRRFAHPVYGKQIKVGCIYSEKSSAYGRYQTTNMYEFYNRIKGFGSDPDATTQRLLNRGARLTELLKQGQFSPMKVEEQVVVIYAGVNGYLDPLPVARVRAFEQGLLGLLRTQQPGILDAIRDTRDLDDATAGKLKAAVDGYAKTFA